MLTFIKKEIVLTASVLLAAASAFVVPPDRAYLRYIDFRTLGILFCLMSVMAGLRRMGVFTVAARALLHRTKSVRQMVLLLTLLCFVCSMLITNDVALMTFVPLTLTMLELLAPALRERWMLFTVVMQTIAANLGSMLTPIGNPQNLYLYGLSGMSVGEFVAMMLPYTLLSLVLLVVCVLLITRRARGAIALPLPTEQPPLSRRRLALYGALFVLSLLSVLRVLDVRLVLLATLAALLLCDRSTLQQVDYALLATFAALFVFIGNMGRLPSFHGLLARLIEGRVLQTAVLCSQVTSNVPAALLLSGFTNRLPELTVGVNLGGLGTLIASMASLISYKFVAGAAPQKRGAYLLLFSLCNVIFLLLLLPAAWLLLP